MIDQIRSTLEKLFENCTAVQEVALVYAEALYALRAQMHNRMNDLTDTTPKAARNDQL